MSQNNSPNLAGWAAIITAIAALITAIGFPNLFSDLVKKYLSPNNEPSPEPNYLINQLENELNDEQWSKANITTDNILYTLMDIDNQQDVIDGNQKISNDKILGISCNTLNEINSLWFSASGV